jgi:hypothetical protein
MLGMWGTCHDVNSKGHPCSLADCNSCRYSLGWLCLLPTASLVPCSWHLYLPGVSSVVQFHSHIFTHHRQGPLPETLTLPHTYCMVSQAFFWNFDRRVRDPITLVFYMPAKPEPHRWHQVLLPAAAVVSSTWTMAAVVSKCLVVWTLEN